MPYNDRESRCVKMCAITDDGEVPIFGVAKDENQYKDWEGVTYFGYYKVVRYMYDRVKPYYFKGLEHCYKRS